MGGLSCPIAACPLYKRGTCKSSTEHVSIHRFPINNARLKQLWEDFVTGQNGAAFKSEKKHGLCSAHFSARFMLPSGRISRDAVPSIAPVSTKKVFCKWNVQNSRLTPISVADEPVYKVPSQIEEESESVSVAVNICMDEEEGSVGIDDNADGLDSAGEINFLQDFDIEPSSICPPPDPNSIYTSDTEVLDTVEKVECAIRQEKEEAVKRYQASVLRVRHLKILLNQLKESDSLRVVSSESTLKNVPTTPISSNLKSPISILTSPTSFIECPSIGDNGLPPPLFDDYN